MAQTLEPQLVQVNSGGILIQWSDGHKSLYAPRALRLRCPCAQCIDEWTRELRLDPESVPLGLETVDHIPVVYFPESSRSFRSSNDFGRPSKVQLSPSASCL